LSSSGAGNKPARPSKSANEYTFSAEHVLDKIFEPGTLLGRSLQLLEDDFSIQNLQCIPQDFALRESCRFDFNFGQNCEYIHIMIGHSMPSTMPEEKEKLKLSLVGALEAKSDEIHADRLKNAKWPNSIVARPTGRSETDSLLLIYAPPSTLVSCCEAQIFSILVRSMVYAPIISFGKGSEPLQLQVNGCCLVLLQHILALDLLEKEQSALKAICPVALTGSATSFSSTLEESALESFLKSLPSGFDEKIGKQTHKVAKILLGRIGLTPRERTVREIFKELFKGKTRSTDGGGVYADVIAEEMLKALETQIVKVKSQKFKVSCPQGEEVINWLQFIGWGTMSATLAEREVYSLLDIMKLPKNALLEICQEKVEEDQSSSQTKEGLYLNFRSSIDDLKSPKKKFHELAKSLQDRLDGFRDEDISWANALFAQHSLEIMVTKRVSLVFYFLLMVSTTGFFILEIRWRVLPEVISYEGLRSSILQLLFSTSLVCTLIPVVIHLGSASWRKPKDVAKFMRLLLGICFCVFILRQAAMITVWFFFDYFKAPGCATDATRFSCSTPTTSARVLDCSSLCAAVVLLTVLVVCPRYLTIILLLVAGLVLMVNGSVIWETQFKGAGIFTQIPLGIFLLLGLMLLMYKRHGDAKRLRHKRQAPMDDYNGAWAELLQGGNVTFVRAKLVAREDLSMSMEEKKTKIQETIQSFADATHVSRAGASRAGTAGNSWLAKILRRIRAKMGITEQISVSLRLKRDFSEAEVDEVRKGLESAMDVGRSQVRLDMRTHTMSASLASLNVLCDKILDDLADGRSQDKAYERAHGQHQWWCKVPCLTRSSNGEAGAEELVVRFCTGGKRLQHTRLIDDLFRDAQRLNNLFHTEIKSLLQQYGDHTYEFIPGPIKKPSRAIEKVVRRYLVAA
jgi:ABC-type multidrug transport system fused ATPase/permease subunit